MNENKLHSLIDQVSEDLSYVIREVGKRGVSESEIDADDFQVLLSRKEFQDLVIGELYESYFFPERHESDWQLLREVVTILTSERVKEFVALSVAGGVIGNSAFAVLRAVMARIMTEMKRAKLPPSKWQPFRGMKEDIDVLEDYFRKKACARIAEVELATGIPRERLYPLLKLSGCSHYRRQHACYWCTPGTTPREDPR
jgi:hypothetical protein